MVPVHPITNDERANVVTVPPGGFLYQRYMHLTGVRAYRAANDGGVYLDALAARDLSRHTYLASSVRVVCPMIDAADPPPGTVRFAQPGFEFVALPHGTKVLPYLLGGGWLRSVWTVWRQLGWADVAFLGFVEHPIPYGWTAAPFAALRKVPWYTFIESSPWRVPKGVRAKRRDRVRAFVTERINRRLFRRATFAFISQPAYAAFLRSGCPHLVSPASWFLHDEMATSAQIASARAEAETRRPHLMYVGRLDPFKGIDVLVAALSNLDAAGVALRFTIMGAGRPQASIEQLAMSLRNVQLAVAPPVLYGPDFFTALRGADALVVPNLSDEQPRNVFDAFSQAVPVLASDTTGLRSIVTDRVDGQLLPVGDVAALADAMAAFVDPAVRAQWRQRGDAGYERAAGYDHDMMHAQRADFIANLGG
ncbi:hypothetical protein BH10ACT2_BH10ACT2_05130 [soil metagenome]